MNICGAGFRPIQLASIQPHIRLPRKINGLIFRQPLKVAAVEREADISGPLSVQSVSANDLVAAAEAGLRYSYRGDPPTYVLTESQ